MLVTGINFLLFPTMFPILSKTKVIFLAIFELSSANALTLVESNILWCDTRLNPYQISFGLVQIESISNFSLHLKWRCFSWTGQKKLLEKEEMLVTIIFSSSHNVFKRSFFFKVIKSQDCV